MKGTKEAIAAAVNADPRLIEPKDKAKRIRLYETVEQLQTVESWIDEALEAEPAAEGVISPVLQELLAEAQLTLEAKCANVMLMARTLDKEAKLIREEAQRLELRAKARERVKEHLRGAVLEALKVAGIQKVQDPRITVWLQNEQDSIEWTGEPEAIPEPFQRVTIELSKTAAKEYLAQFGKLPDGFKVETGRVGVRAR